MKILVCISQVPDTTTKVKFKDNNTLLDETGIQWIINPWDELALTRAMELKEDSNCPVNEVDIINVGEQNTEPTIRKCLAIGADKAFRIDMPPKDAYSAATQIAEFVKTNVYDFIICGIESGDYNGSMVGGMIAELSGLTLVSSVSKISFSNNKAQIEREISNGKEIVEVEGSCILVAQKGFAKDPRIPNMRGIMTARSKPMEVIHPIEAQPLIEFQDYELPESKSKVKMIDADNMSELVDLLSKEAKVI